MNWIKLFFCLILSRLYLSGLLAESFSDTETSSENFIITTDQSSAEECTNDSKPSPKPFFLDLRPPEELEKINNQTSILTKYDRGLWFIAEGNTFRIGGDVELDSRSYLQHSNEPSNFRVRRARFIFEGVLQHFFGYYIVPSFTTREETRLEYAYLETMHPHYARARFGLFKEPFSLEGSRSHLIINFAERSIGLFNFLQLEDIGLMLFGTLAQNKIEYGLGIFNGRGKELENNSKKEFSCRFVYAPFLDSKGLLDQLYFGVSFSTSHQHENLTGKVFTTEAYTVFWEWLGHSNDEVEWNDTRNRWGADFEWYHGPLSLAAEYLHVDWGKIRRGSHQAHFSADSAYFSVTYLVTGETKIRNRWVIPFHSFPDGSGAWELAARYEFVNLNSASLKEGLAKGTSFVQGFTLGINGYLSPYIEVKFNWERLFFKTPIKWKEHWIKGESVIIARLQAIF